MDAKPKILVVDDKPENLVAIDVVLRDLNVELIKVTSGNDALRETLHHNFALALLDIQMPEMDGYELASILREEDKTAHLPFIFISAVYTDNLNVFKGYERGAFSFITKPFQPEILVNKVKFFIEKHQQEISLLNLNKDLEKNVKALEFANKELEAFSYSVSHDLRAPLRAVNGYARILSEDYADKLDDAGRKTIQNICVNATRMGTLIDDLLEFSRLGRKALQKSELNMNVLTEHVVSDFGKAMPHHAEITIHPLPSVMADYTLIYQVMINLIANAVKYSSKKTKPVVEISGTKVEGEVVYTVKDNGAGFDMKYASKLFGVFQRLHSNEEFEGTGVGLAIVQRIITKHGGRIWADATLNSGATFSFTLPLQ
ncbi:MAG TPA: ATP-binding protein [Chitinophagales bacterium]|nr:ATP-binding protein [Chitinophagales bacterium]